MIAIPWESIRRVKDAERWPLTAALVEAFNAEMKARALAYGWTGVRGARRN